MGDAVAKGLRHIELQPPLGKQPVQLPRQLLQRGQAAVKVQHRPGKAPDGALTDHLLAEGADGASAVIPLTVHHHHPAPEGDGTPGPEQMGPPAHPIGQVGGLGVPALDAPQLLGRDGNEKDVFCHGRLPLVQIGRM